MKALILSGGAGTRLRPLTYTGAKQLVPVANKPILFYVIENIVHAGIRDIGIIIAPETGQEVRDKVGSGERWGVNITYFVQEKPLGLAHAVLVAKDFLRDGPFLMYLGDNLIGSRVDREVREFAEDETLAASIFLKPVANPKAFGVAVVDDGGRVVDLVEKPEHPPSNLALVGIYLFRPLIFEAISNISPSRRGELEITDAISWLIKNGYKVQSHMVESWWLDTGKKDDLLLANDTVMDEWLKTDIRGYVDPDSVVTGRVVIEEGARVEQSTIRGPAIIGSGAHLIKANVGPFTAIGSGVRIVRSTVEHCVIMDNCVIEDIPRLEHSVLGRRVRVKPTVRNQECLSLMVGDDCVVEIAT
ncbi:glucose-1-phosphate thymidylyltransferase [Thermodesulforhabdus norvegica]|uniref:Glucose-1-phosphate thymidylyltransferase n=1 Tax=Thermodesulforhabdus norvegica TaxID=39841 RepID=A0A1I4W216_9BACT|nr:glucose-1-phosphate thymidylyltransferase [Thermodesulforhabdus norvegica]SFN07523.1 glucose-1-phosphate thymidylyltransferase [Thermodesulforhabdus norvegica]